MIREAHPDDNTARQSADTAAKREGLATSLAVFGVAMALLLGGGAMIERMVNASSAAPPTYLAEPDDGHTTAVRRLVARLRSIKVN